jgi:thiosulfate reductase cytochrome b subunit
MIWSGLLIYWANDVYTISWGDKTLFHFFPDSFYKALQIPFHLAQGMSMHFFFMWFFMLNGFCYVLYTLLSGEWRYLVPGKKSFAEAFHVVLYDLRLTKKPLPLKKFNGAQQIAYTSVVLMGACSLITGLAIYKPIQFQWLCNLLGGYEMARWEHFWLTIGYLFFFLIHILQVIKAGWNNFRAMVTGYEIVNDAVPHDVNVREE